MRAMDKESIVEVLKEISILLELKGENPFKIRAYQSGARALERLEKDLGELIRRQELTQVSAIGGVLAEKIETLYYTGKLAYYEELKASIPKGFIEMLDIPGLGPKKIKSMNEQLGVDTLEKLEKVCEGGALAQLLGFGEKSQQKILDGIKNREAYGKRHLWWDANVAANRILEGLNRLKAVKKIAAAGSYRRRLETVGDLDFIVGSDDSGSIMDWFVSQEGVQEVSVKGETKSSVRFEGGMQADLRVVPVKQFYFALHHFTGSKDHNVQMRARALSRGLTLSEWGLGSEKGKEGHRKDEISIKSEEELFKALGLSYIPPELREGMGEIEFAQREQIPDLVKSEDIKGVFHNHTTASDGLNTLEEMAAGAMGWEYLGIADHSKSSQHAHGLNEERLLNQVAAIRAYNQLKTKKIHIFSGTECDILSNGQLDFEESILDQLDYVVVSMHRGFGQDEEILTKRTIKAIENPCVTMIGHLTGRLLLQRESYAINVNKVIDAAIANNVIIELNANPKRLDMDWRYWYKASERGLLCSINPDAHCVDHFKYYEAGINAARKGWLTKVNIFNTKSLREVKDYFEV